MYFKSSFMEFLNRNHYCKKCDKRVSYFRFTTKKFVQEDLHCPICQEKVVSYWEKLRYKYIIPYFFGFPFYVMSTIYILWKLAYNSPLEAVDKFITIFNVFICAFIIIVSTLNNKKATPPEISDKSLEKLKVFKQQVIWVIILTLLGLLTAALTNYIEWLIWKGIASLF